MENRTAYVLLMIKNSKYKKWGPIYCEIENGQNSIYIDYFESVMYELQLQFTGNENEALYLFQQFIALQE